MMPWMQQQLLCLQQVLNKVCYGFIYDIKTIEPVIFTWHHCVGKYMHSFDWCFAGKYHQAIYFLINI